MHGTRNIRPSARPPARQPIHLETPEATTVRDCALKDPRPSIFEHFDPPEATTVGHRGSNDPRHSNEDFEPQEAMTVRIEA